MSTDGVKTAQGTLLSHVIDPTMASQLRIFERGCFRKISTSGGTIMVEAAKAGAADALYKTSC
jgi:hypothetical protein